MVEVLVVFLCVSCNTSNWQDRVQEGGQQRKGNIRGRIQPKRDQERNGTEKGQQGKFIL